MLKREKNRASFVFPEKSFSFSVTLSCFPRPRPTIILCVGGEAMAPTLAPQKKFFFVQKKGDLSTAADINIVVFSELSRGSLQIAAKYY